MDNPKRSLASKSSLRFVLGLSVPYQAFIPFEEFEAFGPRSRVLQPGASVCARRIQL